MKLSNIFPQIKTDKAPVKKPKEASPTVSSQQAPAPTDKVELSSGSVDVQRMHEIIQDTPEVRTEKVQALKERISKGEYTVDPYKVADKMLISLLQDNVLE